MLAIGLELLGGRYAATAYNDRERGEWPPHPARLFSALVATWADETSPDERERRALAWLASQPPPQILASGSDDVAHRSVMTVFVPVNDVSVVSAPDREKLDGALAALASADGEKARTKAAKEVAKLETKLAEATAKAIAVPIKEDKGGASKGAAVLPESRTKQPRTFPSVTPECPRLCFAWPEAEPGAEHASALGGLASRLVRLGHSSSLVAARLYGASDVATLRRGVTTYEARAEHGTHVVRWVGPQQLEALERAFELHRETEPRVLPAVFVSYAEGDLVAPRELGHSAFDPSLVILSRVGGPRLPITAAPGLSRQLRRAVMSVLGEGVPELLSGHRDGGLPSESPHLAIVPLPVVGGPHADGAILGVALVFPRDAAPAERKRVLAAVKTLEERVGSPPDEPQVIHLHLGTAGTLELERVAWGEAPRATLTSGRWTERSRLWATATPIALDRNPGNLHAADGRERSEAFAAAEADVARAIERIGLPTPHRVEVSRSCVLSGSAKPRAHGRFPIDHDKPQRVLVHARIEFERAVQGPLLVGAGRYQGLGLCLPTDRMELS